MINHYAQPQLNWCKSPLDPSWTSVNLYAQPQLKSCKSLCSTPAEPVYCKSLCSTPAEPVYCKSLCSTPVQPVYCKWLRSNIHITCIQLRPDSLDFWPMCHSYIYGLTQMLWNVAVHAVVLVSASGQSVLLSVFSRVCVCVHACVCVCVHVCMFTHA